MIAPLPDAVGEPPRVDFPTARALALALAKPLPAESTELSAAAGRVLAETLVARTDLVAFARSAMDGYALRSADSAGASATTPITLPVALDSTYAGDTRRRLPRGVAARIATGAALPAGADTVVPFEDVTEFAGAIGLCAALEPRAYIFEAGDDAKRGEILARAGDVLTAGRVGLLASGGYARVAVHRRPRVAIVSTGDELVDVDAEPRLGQIRNSNATMLAAALERDGAVVVAQTHAADVSNRLRAALVSAIECADLVITTGGASAGERDLVKPLLRSLDARFAFASVALRPSKPTGFASLHPALIAVLPGNPAAAYVAYAAIVRGVVRALAGRTDVHPPCVWARLEGDRIRRKDGRHYLPFGSLRFERGRFFVRLLENQCSSLTRTSADANALIIVEPGSGAIEPNEEVTVEVTDWDSVSFMPCART